MKKIVVTKDLGLSSDQRKRLESLGDVIYHDDLAKSPEEWLERCQGADIILAGKEDLKKGMDKIKNAFFSLRFVGISWIDKEKMKENNNIVSYCPGCNKEAVSEWAIAMMLVLLRNLNEIINIEDISADKKPETTLGTMGKKVTILGQGNIGARIGKVCEALDMGVRFFKRGDDLLESVKEADVVFNSLSLKSDSEGLLNKEFFQSLKKGSFFISFVSRKIFDTDAMIEVLDNNILKGAAIDAGGIEIGDGADPYYMKLVKHPKILATPHIAYDTDVTDRVANDGMIDNVEAYLAGKPINLVE